MLELPPPSIIRYDTTTPQFIFDQLTSAIAGHAQAEHTYTFYEEVDRWLGPWGESGYPIGYGKYYNVLFTTNAKLMANATTKDWVWKTGILLQESLRDWLVQRTRDQALFSIKEPELRQAAFDSHPKAYTVGGLTTVVLVAPELLPMVALIPGKEFDPRSVNFPATIVQVLATIGLVAPRAVGDLAAAAAGPAHNGMLRRAFDSDQERFFAQQRLGTSLFMLKSAILEGKLDDIAALNSIISGLNATQFPDQGFAAIAREIITIAQQRQTAIRSYYGNSLQRSAEVRKLFETQFRSLLVPTARDLSGQDQR